MAPIQKNNGFFQRIALRRKEKQFVEEYGKPLVLIYSMGKVGSSTLKASFDHAYPFLPVYQIHFLSDLWLKKKLPAMSSYFGMHTKWAEEFFSFRSAHPDYRMKIITLVREPVVRNISDVFENGREFFKSSLEEAGEDKIIDWLKKDDYEYTLNWFDTEFFEWTGVDIYSLPFDREKGFSCWKMKDFDLLCIKLEKLDERIEEAMQELAGFPFSLDVTANKSENKEGKELYKSVLKKFRIPAEKGDWLYGSKLVTHFYTEEEIARFKAQWVARS